MFHACDQFNSSLVGWADARAATGCAADMPVARRSRRESSAPSSSTAAGAALHFDMRRPISRAAGLGGTPRQPNRNGRCLANPDRALSASLPSRLSFSRPRRRSRGQRIAAGKRRYRLARHSTGGNYCSKVRTPMARESVRIIFPFLPSRVTKTSQCAAPPGWPSKIIVPVQSASKV
jgi:hypothetical protein